MESQVNSTSSPSTSFAVPFIVTTGITDGDGGRIGCGADDSDGFFPLLLLLLLMLFFTLLLLLLVVGIVLGGL